MLGSRISDTVRRTLWALGLVRVRAKPGDASVATGGVLPLTITLEPRPCCGTVLGVNSTDDSIISVPREIAVKRNSFRITTVARGDFAGRAEVTIRVEPTSRFGQGMQRFLSKVSTRLGLGFATANLTVGSRPILIVAPHPDDEALMASGVIANALTRGEPVKVVIVTNGDNAKGNKKFGLARQAESVAAMNLLGLQPDDVIFLGYPGDVHGLLHMINNYLPPGKIYTSIVGSSATYGAHGLGNRDFHSWLTGEPAPYHATSLYDDLEVLFKAFRPRHIYATSRFDEHPAHRAVYYSLVRAVQSIRLEDPSYAPTLHTTIVHDVTRDCYDDFWESDKSPPRISMDLVGDDFWPIAMKYSENGDSDPNLEFTPPPNLWRTSRTWSDAERMPVPASMQTGNLSENLKYQVLQKYTSQLLRYLAPFCKQDEFFWREEPPRGELLALFPLHLSLHRGEARVLTVSLVRPGTRMLAVALKSSDEKVLIVPPAVLIQPGAVTAVFAIKAGEPGRATVTAILDSPQELATVNVDELAYELTTTDPAHLKSLD